MFLLTVIVDPLTETGPEAEIAPLNEIVDPLTETAPEAEIASFTVILAPYTVTGPVTEMGEFRVTSNVLVADPMTKLDALAAKIYLSLGANSAVNAVPTGMYATSPVVLVKTKSWVDCANADTWYVMSPVAVQELSLGEPTYTSPVLPCVKPLAVTPALLAA
jgi:hypothetical protein